MIDIKEQSERWSHFSQGLQNSIASATGGRRDEIDVLRTAFWFSEIKRYLDAGTSYAVEHKLEPEAFGKNIEGDHYHRNKWPKYEIGRHVPSVELAAKVERQIPGTARLLNHVLWDSLRTKHCAKEKANDWLQQLAPDFQNIVYKPGSFSTVRDCLRVKIGKVLLAKLERRAGIEALACLTILLRESNELGDSKTAMAIGKSLYRVFLILITTNAFKPIAPELVDIYRLRIFPLVRHQGEAFHLDSFQFFEAANILRELSLQLEDAYHIGGSWLNSVRAKIKLLSGPHRLDVKFALDPPLVPCVKRTSENEDIWKRAEQRERFRQWGLNSISSGGNERWPPEEL